MHVAQRAGGRMRIAVDMDEVIADALNEHLLRYNRTFGANLTVADLQGRWLWDAVPREHLDAIEAEVRSADFFRVLGVMPGARDVLARLAEHYEIFIATAAMEVPSSFTAKFEWLAEHFPFIPPSHIVFCGDKSILDADFLVDDNPRQLRLFGGQGVLFSSPANAGVTDWPRAKDWAEVEAFFMSQLRTNG